MLGVALPVELGVLVAVELGVTSCEGLEDWLAVSVWLAETDCT
jgi:hypothetical protein